MRLYKIQKNKPWRKFLGSTQAAIAWVNIVMRNFGEVNPNFPDGNFIQINFRNDETEEKFQLELNKEEAKTLNEKLIEFYNK